MTFPLAQYIFALLIIILSIATMSFAARDYALPASTNGSTYQNYASGPREYRIRPTLTEYLHRVQEQEELTGMSTTPPQSESDSDFGNGSPSPAPMVRDAFPTNIQRTATWAAAHVASDALQNNTNVVLGAQHITNNALSRPGSSDSSNSTRSLNWKERFELREAERKLRLSTMPPPPPPIIPQKKYSESWERLSRGEIAPAPPRPSSSSEDGTYPPGPDRDFGWFARQRERDERILAMRAKRGPFKFGKKLIEKENVPPTGAAAIVESASAIGAPTTAKENVPPENRHWAADDFTAMSVQTSPQLRVSTPVKNDPQVMDNSQIEPVLPTGRPSSTPIPTSSTSIQNDPQFLDDSQIEPVQQSRTSGTPKEEVWEALKKLSRISTPSPLVQKSKSDVDPEERIASETKLFEPDNKSERNSIRAPSPIPPSASPSPPSSDTDDDGNIDATPQPKSNPLSLPVPQVDTSDDGSVNETPRPKPDPLSLLNSKGNPSQNIDVDETPRPKVDPLTLPTPRVTGAYLETPAPTIRKPRPDSPIPTMRNPRQNLTKSVTSRKQEPSNTLEPELGKTQPTLTNSAKPPSFKEDLRRIQLESNYEDSTLDDFDAMLGAADASAPAPSNEADTDEIRLQRMSHSLSKNLLSIRDAKAGISRLENQVSSSIMTSRDDGYIKIGFPRWWFIMLASLLALFMLFMAVGAIKYHVGGHVVRGSPEDWWGGKNGPALSFSGGKEVFDYDDFI